LNGQDVGKNISRQPEKPGHRGSAKAVTEGKKLEPSE